MVIGKEALRLRKLEKAVATGLSNIGTGKQEQTSYISVVIYAHLMAFASSHGRYALLLLKGRATSRDSTILLPSRLSKFSVVAAVVFIMKHNDHIELSSSAIYVILFYCVVLIRVEFMAHAFSPISYVERLLSSIMFGGFVEFFFREIQLDYVDYEDQLIEEEILKIQDLYKCTQNDDVDFEITKDDIEEEPKLNEFPELPSDNIDMNNIDEQSTCRLRINIDKTVDSEIEKANKINYSIKNSQIKKSKLSKRDKKRLQLIKKGKNQKIQKIL